MGSRYPEQEMHFAESFFIAGALTGTPIDVSNFMGNVGSFKVTSEPGLAAPVTVTFEGCDGDIAFGYCQPLNNWAPLSVGGICDATTPFSLTVGPNAPNGSYSVTEGGKCRQPLQCRPKYVRAVRSDVGVTVEMIGKAHRVYSIGGPGSTSF
jgi:hypothetical protein